MQDLTIFGLISSPNSRANQPKQQISTSQRHRLPLIAHSSLFLKIN